MPADNNALATRTRSIVDARERSVDHFAVLSISSRASTLAPIPQALKSSLSLLSIQVHSTRTHRMGVYSLPADGVMSPTFVSLTSPRTVRFTVSEEVAVACGARALLFSFASTPNCESTETVPKVRCSISVCDSLQRSKERVFGPIPSHPRAFCRRRRVCSSLLGLQDGPLAVARRAYEGRMRRTCR